MRESGPWPSKSRQSVGSSAVEFVAENRSKDTQMPYVQVGLPAAFFHVTTGLGKPSVSTGMSLSVTLQWVPAVPSLSYILRLHGFHKNSVQKASCRGCRFRWCLVSCATALLVKLVLNSGCKINRTNSSPSWTELTFNFALFSALSELKWTL